MGCDIHFFVERRVAKADPDVCINCGGGLVVDHPDSFWHGVVHSMDLEKHCDESTLTSPRVATPTPDAWVFFEEIDLVRNYRLFAALADVRNEDEGIRPIDAPRGLPKDVSQHVAAAEDNEWFHSQSWFTIGELLAHHWDVLDLSHHFVEALLGMARFAEGDLTSVRAVFGFDG